MVQKLHNDEYLKRYDKMTLAERQAYKDRVGQWLRSGGRLLTSRQDDSDSRLQNVMTASVSWNDAECQAFEEGAQLLSSQVNGADTWLPNLLYVKSARRAIRQMTATLAAIPAESPHGNGQEERQNGECESLANGLSSSLAVSEEQKKRIVDKYVNKVLKNKEKENVTQAISGIPSRPNHIDQYVHLLPVKTQERASKVKDLLRELDYAREKARLLMGSPQASPDIMASWAKKATACDNALRSIYKELDAEWEKLVKSGRIEVDVFGNAHISEELRAKSEETPKELNSEQKLRRRELRKWLIDTRRGGTGKMREKRIEQWKEKWKEYLTLEPLDAALKDEKIVAAAVHFGINIGDCGEGTSAFPQFTEQKIGGREAGKQKTDGEAGEQGIGGRDATEANKNN